MTHVTVNHLTIDGGFYCATQSVGIWNFYILKLYRYLFAIEKIFSIFLSFKFAFFCGVENSLGQNVTYVTYMLRSFKRPYFSVKLKAMKNQLRYDFSLIIYIFFFIDMSEILSPEIPLFETKVFSNAMVPTYATPSAVCIILIKSWVPIASPVDTHPILQL